MSDITRQPTTFAASGKPHPFEVLGRQPFRRRAEDSPTATHSSPERRTESDPASRQGIATSTNALQQQQHFKDDSSTALQRTDRRARPPSRGGDGRSGLNPPPASPRRRIEPELDPPPDSPRRRHPRKAHHLSREERDRDRDRGNDERRGGDGDHARATKARAASSSSSSANVDAGAASGSGLSGSGGGFRRESIEEIESGHYRPRPGRRPFRAERGRARKDVIIANMGGRSVRRYVCQETDCGKSFTTSGHLTRHMRTHSGHKPHLCPVEGCERSFARRDNMRQHYQSHARLLSGGSRPRAQSTSTASPTRPSATSKSDDGTGSNPQGFASSSGSRAREEDEDSGMKIDDGDGGRRSSFDEREGDVDDDWREDGEVDGDGDGGRYDSDATYR